MGLWRWLNTPKPWVRRPRCPLCGREIVGDLGPVRDGSWLTWKRPTYRDAKIAHCPVHGKDSGRGTHYHFPRRPRGRARDWD